MPKKVLFSKEFILNKSFELFKEKGIDAISARNVAKILDASSAPIYRAIGSMDILKKELIKRAKDLFMEYLIKKRTGIKFLDIGMGISIFAREEKQLFLQIFTKDNIEGSLIDEFLNLLHEEIKKDERLVRIDKEKQEELLISCWVFAHGLSTLIATGFFKDPNDEFIEKVLRNAPAKLFYEYIDKYSK
ncbi:TetR/AcrR family transcriptional regulator [Fusobacterium simiae]|uniref:TetR/AcrR family transcriptional regulator n=1 Tax=Fusobacterium TaxID=848 RepID=UPI0003F8B5B2|nr:MULTISPECIES: TetR/AcrR family transcriptional regulator [Fusobacterium]MDC7955456.1 TetR/AcrR family transcriptional regulator [Fusobacterium simiae]